MRRSYGTRIVSSALIIFVLATAADTALAQNDAARRPAREKWEENTIQAIVEAVDIEKREVLLRGPKGNLVTLEADKTANRLDEIEVGDLVTAEFWTHMKAEFREPTPAEKNEPLRILEERGRTPKGKPPGAIVGATIKAVVSIEIISRPDMVVTVKGPRGRYVTIPAEDPALLEKLRIGEVVILTYTEAVALSLQKVNPQE